MMKNSFLKFIIVASFVLSAAFFIHNLARAEETYCNSDNDCGNSCCGTDCGSAAWCTAPGRCVPDGGHVGTDGTVFIGHCSNYDNTCTSVCEGSGCSCTPTQTCNTCECVEPTGLSWLSPANGSPIKLGDQIKWQGPDSWGVDSGQICTNPNTNTCTNGTSGGNADKYFLYVDGVNKSDICQESTGSGAGAFITGTTCTLKTEIGQWYDQTKDFVIKANNSCGSVESTITYTVQNQKPFCSNINVTGGILNGGNLYVNESEQLSFAFEGQDPDAEPKFINICYTTNGHQEGPWYCQTSPSPATSYSITNITFNQMVANLASVGSPGNPTVDGIYLVTNVFDHYKDLAYCTGEGTYNDNGVLSTCPDGNCSKVIRLNNSPSIDALTPSSAMWIGTEPDSDNPPSNSQLSCNDNNPASYIGEFSDVDGSEDVNVIQANLAPDSTITNADSWPLRVMFARSLQGQSPNSFYIQDKKPSVLGKCYDINRNVIDAAQSNYWCYAAHANTHDTASTTNGIIGGVPVVIYYLNRNLSVYSEGYSADLLGSSNWANSSYVAYQTNGNKVFANLKVRFNNDQNKWQGLYSNVFYVSDTLGAEDESANIPGESIFTVAPNQDFHKVGTSGVDFVSPNGGVNGVTVAGAQKVNVSWNFSELGGSGVLGVSGHASLAQGGINNGNIAHVSSNNPGTVGCSSYDISVGNCTAGGGGPLWSALSPSTSGIDVVDILSNEGGQIDFQAGAADNACNYGGGVNTGITLGEPWIVTRGGNLYSSGGTDIEVKSLDGTDTITPDPIWNPFWFAKNELDLSTELLSSGNSDLNNLLHRPVNNAFSLKSYSDQNNKSWFTDLEDKLDQKLSINPDNFSVVNSSGGALSGSLGASCPATDKACIIRSSGSVTISQGYKCDRRGLIFVNGDITVNPDVTRDGGSINGCIFVASGKVNILGGVDQVYPGICSSSPLDPSCYPRYDTLEAFVIADDQVFVQEADSGRDFHDGLRVHGGLLGFGSGGSEPAVKLQRSLKLLDNNQYPSVVIHFDPVYLELSKEFFGGEVKAYKSEVGFKPL